MFYIYVLPSLTYAMKAKKLLGNSGISAEVIKSSNMRAIYGCGYGLRVSSANADYISNIFSSNGISVLGVIGER